MGCHSSKLSQCSSSCSTMPVVPMPMPMMMQAELQSLIDDLNRTFPTLKINGSVLSKLNHSILLLVKDDLTSAILAIKLLAALKVYLINARKSHALMLEALHCFDKEEFLLAFANLKEFKETHEDDPLTAATPLTSQIVLLLEQLNLLLGKVTRRKVETQGKIHRVKKWKKILKCVSFVAIFAFSVLSFVFLAISAPPVAITLTAQGANLLNGVVQGVDSVLATRLGTLEGEHKVSLMISERLQFTTIPELENIRVIMNRLESKFHEISDYAKFATDCDEEEAGMALANAMKEITGMAGAIEEWVVQMEVKMGNVDGEIGKGTADLLKIIADYHK